MALMIDDIRFYEMFAEPSRQPTPEEVTAAKWLLRQIAKRAAAREGDFTIIEQTYDIYTKQANIVADQQGRKRTFGHLYLSPDGRQTFDGPHVPEWAR
ncbi:MAG: hypothetical protein O7G88_06310 [bacterium]|nr:hypothetical protein [bacterium]